jgi:GNAT superfamily N-acetyltransferase
MTQPVSFREATAADASSILDMMSVFNAIDNYSFDRALAEYNIEALMTNSVLGRLWLIQHDKDLIGYIVLAFGFSFEYGGRDAFIDELFLSDGFRNKGIGTMAMNYVEEQAALLGVKTIHLEVEQHNVKGNKLYLKSGFRNNNRMLLTKKLKTKQYKTKF